ncbi:hypothetical protein D3X11_02075 [Streptococcus sp. X16XC17]|nr:hypothetical protein D3X11_02075 [Streptococcus sp. X16XC17]
MLFNKSRAGKIGHFIEIRFFSTFSFSDTAPRQSTRLFYSHIRIVEWHALRLIIWDDCIKK